VQKLILLVALFWIVGCAQSPAPVDGGDPGLAEEQNSSSPLPGEAEGLVDAPPTGVRGYGDEAWRRQGGLEARLARDVRPARCADFLRTLTAEAHPPGSDANRRIGRNVAELFKSWELRVRTDTHEVLVPTPIQVSVEMSSPYAFAAEGKEPPIETDFDTQSKQTLPPYAAFSPDADLEAEVVYANYGRREDLALLRASGVEVKGKILLCRLGETYRGSKVWLAERAGAVGVLLYSDPADDGFARGEVHPRGPFRPEGGASRGTILYTFLRPGDPGTPGRASLEGAEQLTFDEMETLPRIPATCLSFADARPILEGLGGAVVPETWRGAGPFTYHFGGDGACVTRLEIAMDYRLRPIDTIVATLPGTDLADQEILVTCHRDAWTHGAIDPGSGHAVMLEVARLLAARRDDEDPLRRSVRFLSFGAEELGLVGSTEWLEQHRADLREHAILVVDLDATISGSSFEVDGSSSWRQFTENVGTFAPEGREARMRFGPPRLDADHAPFLAHLGIPALSIGLRGDHGLAHSRYDTFSALRKHLDPNFGRHARVAEFVARLVARAANADILPRDFGALADDILNRIDLAEAAHPELDLAPLRDPARELKASGQRLEVAREELLQRGSIDRDFAREIDAIGRRAEALLVFDEAKRFWRHALHAPDPARGYLGFPLPSLEAALGRGRTEAQREGARLAQRFGVLAAEIESLTLRIEGVLKK
jgi:N-acetylated-alpha-linked acidic dipeptidase